MCFAPLKAAMPQLQARFDKSTITRASKLLWCHANKAFTPVLYKKAALLINMKICLLFIVTKVMIRAIR